MPNHYDKQLLNALMDKYERSTAFRTGKPSAQRIQLKLYDNGENNFKAYDTDSHEIRVQINQTVIDLSKRHFLSFSWMKGEENHLIAKVWLNLESLCDVYRYLNRTPKSDIIDAVCLQLMYAVDDAGAPWAKQFFKDTYDAISSKRTIGSRLPACEAERKDLIHCICFASKLEDTEMLERVFSLQCFGDSKRFEKHVRSRMLGILRHYTEVDVDARDEDLLRQIGISKYPEQFEFCGALSLDSGLITTDFSGLQFGAAIFRGELDHGNIAIRTDVQRIISIENRANFIDYIHKQKQHDELVLYHGGQYSPAKKHFFKMIARSIPPGCRWFHWGDIDYGGFSMLLRLRREIHADVKAYRMGIEELIKHRGLCASFAVDYAQRLQKLLLYSELFDCHDCIRFMLDNTIRLEQEALL